MKVTSASDALIALMKQRGSLLTGDEWRTLLEDAGWRMSAASIERRFREIRSGNRPVQGYVATVQWSTLWSRRRYILFGLAKEEER